jgi:RNA polymerase sigma-70 factor, ECF subfamily
MMVPAMANLASGAAPAQAEFTARLEAVLDAAHRLATVMLRDRSAAEDAVQEAAVKAWRKQDQLRGGERFGSWFLSIVANECRMARRTRWWHVIRSGEPVESAEPPPDAFAASDLRAAVMRLEPGDRAALFCFFYLDMPMEEVARVLRVSPAAARARVYRAARKLRPGLDPTEDLR